MNEEDARALLRRYVQKGWARRLTALQWLVDAGGKIEWQCFRQLCSETWYPLSYYPLYLQLADDGLIATRWQFSGQPDEREAWTYTLILAELLPAVADELARLGEAIDALRAAEEGAPSYVAHVWRCR